MYRIDQEKCYLCGLCFDICAAEAITFLGVYQIDQDLCNECGECYDNCPLAVIIEEHG